MEKQTVINPKTKRPIVVGGRVWVRLVREGILNHESQGNDFEIAPEEEAPGIDDSGTVLTDDTEADDTEEVEEEDEDQLRNLDSCRDSDVPKTHLVRGRGKNKNKMVPKHKPLKPEEISREITDCAVKAVKKYSQIYSENYPSSDDYGDEHLDNLIQQMIMDELAMNNQSEDYELESA